MIGTKQEIINWLDTQPDKEYEIKENLNSALVSRGHQLLEIEDYDNAMTNFKTAIKEGFTDGSAYFGMAKIYRAQGENSKASDNYEKAISLDPDKTQYSAEYSEFISSLSKPKTTTPSSSTEESEEQKDCIPEDRAASRKLQFI